MPVKLDENAKKNKYYYVFEVRDVHGKRVTYKKRGFRTKKEAEVAEIAKRNEVNHGVVLKPQKTLYADYLVEWIKNRRDLRESTKHSYTRMINNHIIPIVGRTLLSDLNTMAVESIVRSIEGKGFSSGHNKNFCHIIHKSLQDAVIKGMIASNPASLITKPKRQSREMSYWTPEEAKKFLVATRSHRLHLIFALAIHCGLRRGEILGLRVSDVDLENKRLSIRNIINFKKALQPGAKTVSGIRSVDIPNYIVEQIRIRLQTIEEEREKYGDGYHNLGHLICTKSGQPLSLRSLGDVWARLQQKHKMRRIRFHDLRHTCATLLLSLDIHPKVVQSMLGHSSYKITMDLYSHVMPNIKSNAAEALENLLK
ncbi:hypothetical protein B1748_19885 [Paenibacillus sp. MY03]|uniref:site-specific integrase n=1 Tax=Paenibacillus sp. MY03 TaxID=302980 RepID=UPI000B3C836D|nr:site-specific integrase [Paenibacillus sp. MY03]OUS74845.1 hypothetical protein B1748_19885 [Paenibacillus sp. MY03]